MAFEPPGTYFHNGLPFHYKHPHLPCNPTPSLSGMPWPLQEKQASEAWNFLSPGTAPQRQSNLSVEHSGLPCAS